MSTGAVYEFINRSEEDADLQARLRETQGSQAIVGLAAERGYDFTPAELEPVVSMLAFFRGIWENEALRDAVTNAEDNEAVARIAAEHGYTFSPEALAHVSLIGDSGELAEEELGAVAGGAGTTAPSSGLRVSLTTTTTRETSDTDFGTMLKNAASDTDETTRLAAPFVPGASVITAAISGGSLGGA